MSYSFSQPIKKNKLNLFSISVGELGQLTNTIEEIFEFFQACPELEDSTMVVLLADSLQRSREEIDARLIFKKIVNGKFLGKENEHSKQLIHRLKGSSVLQRPEYKEYKNLIDLLSDPKLLPALKHNQYPSFIDKVNAVKEDSKNVSLLNVLLHDKVFWKIFSEEYALKKGEDYIKYAKSWINSTKLLTKTDMYGVQNGILRWDTLKGHPDFLVTLEKIKELYFGSEARVENSEFARAINDAFVQRKKIWKEKYLDIEEIYNEEQLRELLLENIFEQLAGLVLMSHIYPFENEFYKGAERSLPLQVALSELGNPEHMKLISVVKSTANVVLSTETVEHLSPKPAPSLVNIIADSTQTSSEEVTSVGSSRSSASYKSSTSLTHKYTEVLVGISTEEEENTNEKEKSDHLFLHSSPENVSQLPEQISLLGNSFTFFSRGAPGVPIAKLRFSACEVTYMSYIPMGNKVMDIDLFHDAENRNMGGFSLKLSNEPLSIPPKLG